MEIEKVKKVTKYNAYTINEFVRSLVDTRQKVEEEKNNIDSKISEIENRLVELQKEIKKEDADRNLLEEIDRVSEEVLSAKKELEELEKRFKKFIKNIFTPKNKKLLIESAKEPIVEDSLTKEEYIERANGILEETLESESVYSTKTRSVINNSEIVPSSRKKFIEVLATSVDETEAVKETQRKANEKIANMLRKVGKSEEYIAQYINGELEESEYDKTRMEIDAIYAEISK